MTIIHAQWLGEQALVPKEDFERLLELARKSEMVDVCSFEEEISTHLVMRLAESSGAFSFWNEPGEDIYSATDGEPI